MARIQKGGREITDRAAIQATARRVHRGHGTSKIAHRFVAQVFNVARVQRRMNTVEGAQNLQSQTGGARQTHGGAVAPGLLLNRVRVATHGRANQRRHGIQIARAYRVGQHFSVHTLILNGQLLREPGTHVRAGH